MDDMYQSTKMFHMSSTDCFGRAQDGSCGEKNLEIFNLIPFTFNITLINRREGAKLYNMVHQHHPALMGIRG